MNIIPTTIVDNFFNDPNAIRSFALEQEYRSDDEGRWPGQRTKPLHLLDEKLFTLIAEKFFSYFFDPENKKIEWLISMAFQKVGSYYDTGWAHYDIESCLTGIIYLNPRPPFAGTSILKSNVLVPDTACESKYKHYKNNIKNKETAKHREANNKQYQETIRVEGVYNRLLAFDSSLPHVAHDFFGSDKEDERLTLVLFVNNLKADVKDLPAFKTKKYII